MSSVTHDDVEKQLSRSDSGSSHNEKRRVEEPAGPVALAFAESANRAAALRAQQQQQAQRSGEGYFPRSMTARSTANEGTGIAMPRTTTFMSMLGGGPPKDPSEVFPRTATRNSHRVAAFRTLSIQVGETAPDHKRRHGLRRHETGGETKSALQKVRALIPFGKKDDEDDEKRQQINSAEQADYFVSLDYHTVTPKEVCDRFNTDPDQGLDKAAVQRRLAEDGPNTLTRKRANPFLKVLGYLTKGFCSILWIGVILFFICWKPLGEPDPQAYNLALSILILAVIFLQAGFTALQDYSTAKVMDSIKGLMPAHATVLRDGEKQTVDVASLVAGDIVVLAQGTRVPADIRLLTVSDDLAFDRAVLTGESEEVSGIVEDDEANFLESKDIAFLGSFVASGAGTGVVVLTGGRSVMGRINKLTNTGVERKTNLQKEIDRFVLIICAMTVTLILIMLIVWLGFLRPKHNGFLNVVGILVNMMSLVVAFIPEGMPMAVTLTLTVVAKRMRDVKVLPKSLSTVETLGCVQVLLSDKTGTLTANEMTVTTIHCDGQTFPATTAATDDKKQTEAYKALERGLTLCNQAFFEMSAGEDGDEEKKMVAKGNATDCAVLHYVAAGEQYETTRAAYNKVAEIPFNSTNKWMSNTHVDGATGELLVLMKGAPDMLLPKCNLTDDERTVISRAQEELASQGQRTILLTRKPTKAGSEAPTEQELQNSTDLVFLGLIGIVDPPRPEIPHTVREVRRSGARFHMVTGDFITTAVAIARQCEIVTAERVARLSDIPESTVPDFEPPQALAIEGKEIVKITQAQWDVICQVPEIVFGRTSPENKLRIVQEHMDRKLVTCVTGDGTNDSPALKAADVGIAILGGSDVAIESADLILMGSLASIIEGIRNGRLVFQNLQKVISYLLPAGSFSEDIPVFLNVFFGVPLPLSSFYMIIICVFTDLVSCLTLIAEKEEFDLLTLPPRDAKKDHLVNLRLYGHSYMFIGVIETLCAHAMFFLYMWQEARIPVHALFFAYEKWEDGFYGYTIDELNHFLSVGQSVYFVTLVIMQIGNLLSIRSRRESILRCHPLRAGNRNLWIFVGPIFSISIAIFVTMLPGLQSLMSTATVPIRFWMIPIPLAVGLVVADEVRKLAARTWPNGIVARVSW